MTNFNSTGRWGAALLGLTLVCAGCAAPAQSRMQSTASNDSATISVETTTSIDKRAVASSIDANSPLRTLSESDRIKAADRAEAEGRERVANWIRSFGDDSAGLTSAILNLPRGESTAIPAIGPASSLAESGSRASRVIYGRIVAVGAEPSGLVYLKVQPIKQPDDQPQKVTFRAVVRFELNTLKVVSSSGQYFPSSLKNVVVVTDRFEDKYAMPQPSTGVYEVDTDGRVSAQADSPLAEKVDGMNVDELLLALGGEH